MKETRKRAIKMFWKLAKEKCPFQTEEIVNGYLEGFIDCAEYLLLQNTELEQENAELKRDKSELCNAINEEGKAWVKLNEKLSKAKGFIEKLLIVSCNSEILIQYPNCKEVLEARVALEQFLMENK